MVDESSDAAERPAGTDSKVSVTAERSQILSSNPSVSAEDPQISSYLSRFDHRDLWGTDPEPNVGVLELLTPGERATLQSLSAEGNIRLEQERIPWSYALARLGVS